MRALRHEVRIAKPYDRADKMNTYCDLVSMLVNEVGKKWQCTHQNKPPARASKAAPPIAIPTIAPVDRPEEPDPESPPSSEVAVADAAVALVVLALVVGAESVTVTVVALCARCSMDV